MNMLPVGGGDNIKELAKIDVPTSASTRYTFSNPFALSSNSDSGVYVGSRIHSISTYAQYAKYAVAIVNASSSSVNISTVSSKIYIIPLAELGIRQGVNDTTNTAILHYGKKYIGEFYNVTSTNKGMRLYDENDNLILTYTGYSASIAAGNYATLFYLFYYESDN